LLQAERVKVLYWSKTIVIRVIIILDIELQL